MQARYSYEEGRGQTVRSGWHEKGNGLNSDGETCWAEAGTKLSSFSEVRRGVCLYLLP